MFESARYVPRGDYEEEILLVTIEILTRPQSSSYKASKG